MHENIQDPRRAAENKNDIRFYIPPRITKALAQSNAARFQRTEKIRGGILFFDLVNFTRLTSALAESGPRGAEKLHELMTNYYDLMLEIIHRYGGTVYQFAGDSALAAFEEKKDGEIATMLNISACTLEMRRSLRESRIHYKNQIFGAKFAVSYGEFYQILLGDDATYFQIALIGSAIETVIRAERFAQEGDIVLAPELAGAIGDKASIITKDSIYFLENLNVQIDTPKTNELADSEIIINDEAKFLRQCARFIAPVLAEKIKASQMGYIGEFRDVTSVFIQASGIDFSTDPKKAIENLNEIYKHTRALCDTYGGILAQGDFTDKGVVFLVIFGAPIALEKKEMMAVRFALRLFDTEKDFSYIQNFNIGIATGPLYCGDVGSRTRKGYSVLGESANLASRLMEYSAGKHPTLDPKTAKGLPGTFLLEEKSGVKLKGISESLTIYTATGEKKFDEVTDDHAALIGRKQELAWFKTIVTRTDKHGITAGIIGEAGVGKSCLVNDLIFEARKEKFEIYSGISYSYEKFTPHFPWKSILLKIFQVHDVLQTEFAIHKIEETLKSLSDTEISGAFEVWAQVFYRLLGGSVQEPAYTANMDPKKKSEHIFNIVGAIIAQKASSEKMLFLFEDFHWIDEASENLIRYIRELDTPGLLLLLVSRPEGPIMKLHSQENIDLLTLNEFSEEDALNFVRIKMNLNERDAKTIKLEQDIIKKGHGNPLFLESIVYSLREQGILVPDKNGKNILSRDAHNIEIPDSLQGVLLSRIDRLNEEEQIILKNASVIGRLFEVSLLKYITQGDFDSSLSSNLMNLESHDFTILDSSDPLAYVFKHILIRDAAYQTLLSATKATLHNRIGNYLESLGQQKIQENIDLLAYHFLHAKNENKAIKYSIEAARNAKSAYSISDAIHHYGNALELLQNVNNKQGLLYEVKIELGHVYRNGGFFAEALDIFQEPLEMVKGKESLARIHTGIGQVYQEQGDTDLALPELEKAMELLGTKIPKNKIAATVGILTQLLKRALYRALPFLPVKATGKRLRNLELQFEILEYLAKIYFFIEIEKFGWVNLMQANISDGIKTDRARGSSYATLSLIYAGLGLYSLSDKTAKKSEIFTRKTNDPLMEAWLLERTGAIEMYKNNPILWSEKLTKALQLNEKFAGIWEKVLSKSLKSVAYSYAGKIKEGYENNKNVLDIAISDNVKQFQGWALSLNGLFEYILNLESPENCLAKIDKGIAIGRAAKDTAGLMTAKRYALIIWLQEGMVETALDNLKDFFEGLNAYSSIIPFTHSGYYEIIETLELALSKNLISKKDAFKIWHASLSRLKKLGRKFFFLTGYALRAEAKTLAFEGKKQAAQKKIAEAVDWYETTQNEWDKTQAYYDAAVLIPEKRSEYTAKGINLCEKNGYSRDLIRFQNLVTPVSSPM